MQQVAAITLAAASDQLIRKAITARQQGEPIQLDIVGAIVGPWLFGADTVGKLIGLTPADDAAKRRFSLVVHWSYGTAWGISLGLMELAGLRGPLAMGALLGEVLGAEMVAWPAMGLYGPPKGWGQQAVVASVYQHAIYALAAGLTFDALNP